MILFNLALPVLILHIALGLAAMNIWFERKVSALMQDRLGANRAGLDITLPWYLFPLKPLFFILAKTGLLNTLFCDPVKAILKEDFVSSHSSKILHFLSPFAATFPIFLAFAFLPVGPAFTLENQPVLLQVFSSDYDLLIILALTTIAVYGTTLAGWTSANKFAFLGSLRASAQMISYELVIGLVILSVIVYFESANFMTIVEGQKKIWGILTMPLGFLVFLVAGMAETKRGPFDLAESESELVAGYFTEYSGMKFLLFWFGEFAEIALFSFVLSLCFLGGWHLPFFSLPEGFAGSILGSIVLLAKVVFLCFFQIVVRWTLPRFRYDQLMLVCWKFLLPLAVVNLIVTCLLKWLF